MITYDLKEKKSSRIGNFPTIESLYSTIPRSVREHSDRVAEYGQAFYRYIYTNNPEYIRDIGDSEFYNNAHTAFMLHDLGKVYIPVYVFNKAMGLTDEEFALVKEHAVLGIDAFKSIYRKPFSDRMMKIMTDIATCHHERWDGKGYPYGLKGEEIPVGARICAIVDAFDGMVSWKAYRRSMMPQTAMEIINKESGTQFDPVLVEYFNQCYRLFPIDET